MLGPCKEHFKVRITFIDLLNCLLLETTAANHVIKGNETGIQINTGNDDCEYQLDGHLLSCFKLQVI